MSLDASDGCKANFETGWTRLFERDKLGAVPDMPNLKVLTRFEIVLAKRVGGYTVNVWYQPPGDLATTCFDR